MADGAGGSATCEASSPNIGGAATANNAFHNLDSQPASNTSAARGRPACLCLWCAERAAEGGCESKLWNALLAVAAPPMFGEEASHVADGGCGVGGATSAICTMVL